MIRLNCQLKYRPIMCVCHITDDLIETIMYGTNQDFPSPLRAPDDMVDNQMNRVLFVLILHVDTVLSIYKSVK